jgi:hypothetical protein
MSGLPTRADINVGIDVRCGRAAIELGGGIPASSAGLFGRKLLINIGYLRPGAQGRTTPIQLNQ